MPKRAGSRYIGETMSRLKICRLISPIQSALRSMNSRVSSASAAASVGRPTMV